MLKATTDSYSAQLESVVMKTKPNKFILGNLSYEIPDGDRFMILDVLQRKKIPISIVFQDKTECKGILERVEINNPNIYVVGRKEPFLLKDIWGIKRQ